MYNLTLWEFLLASFLIGFVIFPLCAAMLVSITVRTFYLSRFSAYVTIAKKGKSMTDTDSE